MYRSDGQWVARLPDSEVMFDAPDAYLQWTQEVCDGRLTTSALRELAQARWQGDFSRFWSWLTVLADAGVVIDAAHLLWRATSLAQNPNDWGGRQFLHAPPEPAPAASLASAVQLMPSAVAPKWMANASRRHSCYEFDGRALTRLELAGLMGCVAVMSDGVSTHSSQHSPPRAIASAGALYPVELTVVLLKRIDSDLDAGVYRVAPLPSGTVELRPCALGAVDVVDGALRACLSPLALHGAAAWLVLSGDMRQVLAKYRNLAVPHVYVEAGAVLQNLQLLAAELDLGSLPLAAMDSKRVSALCSLGERLPLLSVAIGGTSTCSSAVRRPRPVRLRWAYSFGELPFEVAIAEQERSPRHDGASDAEVCFGKDTSAFLACEKAHCEWVERAAMRETPRAWRVTSMAELVRKGESMLDPRHLFRLSAVQYASGRTGLHEPENDHPIRWVKGRSLATGKTAWVPADLVYSASAFSDTPEPTTVVQHRIAYANTSGMAAAPSLRMAIQNSLLELIERDAFMRFWISRVGASELNPDDLGQKVQRISRTLRESGLRLALLALESPWASVVLAACQDKTRHFTLVGAAASFGYADTAAKALTEIAVGALARTKGVQTRSVRLEDVRTPVDHMHLYCQPEHWRRLDFLFDQPRASRALLSHQAGSLPSLGECIGRLRASGLDPHIVPMPTRRVYRGFGGARIKVVRALVPGLVPMTFGAHTLPLGMGVPQSVDCDEFPHPFP